MIDHALESASLGAIFGLFVLGAAVVWFAGQRLALFADQIAQRTGIGRAFLGMVLLAGVTDLPECVNSLTAIAADNAPLAVNNLFGGIVMQTAVLAIADLLLGKGPLSYFTPRPEVLLQGVLLIAVLSLVLVGIVAGEAVVVGGVGGWTALAFCAYLGSVWLVGRFEGDENWRPVDLPDALTEAADTAPKTRVEGFHLRKIVIGLVLVSLAILASGVLLVATGEQIAHRTGLGSSFVGATLLAATTSLPEVSTTLAAVRMRAYGMAFGNIFGSNAIVVAMLFVTDVFYRTGPILETVDRSATFAAIVGIFVTAVYLVGLLMRRRWAVLRMGVDSLIVMLTYVLTILGLYVLRAG